MSRGRRPRISGQNSSAKLWFYLTDDEKAQLRSMSDESGLAMAAIVREAINEFVSDYAERRVFDRTVSVR